MTESERPVADDSSGSAAARRPAGAADPQGRAPSGEPAAGAARDGTSGAGRGEAGGTGGRARWERVGHQIGTSAAAAAPVVKRGALRFGDWLARIGWGKFFVLAILFLMFGSFASRLLVGSTVVVDHHEMPPKPVDVHVTVSPRGILIGPNAVPPVPPVPPVPAAPSAPPAPAAPTVLKNGGVTINDRGVQIVSDKGGRRVRVTIDEQGIRVDDSAPSAEQSDTVEIPAAALADTEKVDAAVEEVRAKIEEIVQEQIDQRVERVEQHFQTKSSEWLSTLITLAIVAMIIIKIVLGSKRKAESRAQVATATAAEEGLKRQLAEAQLKMMQAQVEPHFLFNTLASVDYLIETDPARASKMQKNLIQYLRAALPQMRQGSTTLGKELALCRSYLEILKVRMDDRLQFALTVPQGLLSARFPPMMLQSLVENSIKHGLEPKPDGGAMTLSAHIANGNLRVTVSDTGLGFGTANRPGTGVGLANVRERLLALYGSSAKLTIESNAPSGTIATIEVPYAIDVDAPVSNAVPTPDMPNAAAQAA